MNRYKIITVLVILLLLFGLMTFLINGWTEGFAWEKAKAAELAEKYVKENYALTPINVNVLFSVDGLGSACIVTEELPFGFSVLISRKDLEIYGDLYLDELIRFHLEKFIKNKVPTLDVEGDIRVILESRFTSNSTELSVEEVNADPEIIFSTPKVTYYCSVSGIEPGSEKSLLVFKQITRNFTPTSISFNYHNKSGKETYIRVNEKNYKDVTKASDLLNFTINW